MSGASARIRYRVFALARRLLPRRWHEAIGRSRLLRPLRDAFLRPAGAPSTMAGPVEFEGLRFHYEASFHGFEHARTRGVEATLSRHVNAWIEPGWTCVDVGAHCGFLTLVAALCAGESGRTIACEADAATAAILRRNVAANDLADRCRVVEARIGAGDRPSVRLDAVLDALGVERVDLVKIDIDGGDLDVLRGAERILRRDRPIVIVELAANARAILETLRGLGYSRLLDMSLDPVDPDAPGFAGWPPNLIATDREMIRP